MKVKDKSTEELKSLVRSFWMAYIDKEAPEFLTKEEERALDRDLLLDTVKRIEGLEAREAERETESKTFLETLAKAVKAKAGEPGGAGSPEHQTVPPEGKQGPAETGGKGGEVDGTETLAALLDNLETLSGPK